MKNGKIKVNKKLSGYIKVGKKKYQIPNEYDLSPREKYHNAECEFELEGGRVIKILVDGTPIPKDEKKVAAKEAKKQHAEKMKQQQAQRDQYLKNNEQKFANDSFSLDKCLLPQDTAGVDIRQAEIDNFNLKFHQYARYDENDCKFKFFQKDRKKGDFEIIFYSGDLPIENIAKREKENALALLGGNTSINEYKVSWRLSVGLGQQSVYETSINLHHIYGIPFIPASSLKGIVRSYVIITYFQGKEEKAIKNKSFCDLFGCPGVLNIKDEKNKIHACKSYYEKAMRGRLVFWDSFPVENPTFKTDVMNPHYPDYYGKDKPPTDTQNPIPIYFLTVENTKFQFIVGHSKSTDEFEIDIPGSEVKQSLAFIQFCLKQALTQHGIGAKTAVGYGYMDQ